MLPMLPKTSTDVKSSETNVIYTISIFKLYIDIFEAFSDSICYQQQTFPITTNYEQNRQLFWLKDRREIFNEVIEQMKNDASLAIHKILLSIFDYFFFLWFNLA